MIIKKIEIDKDTFTDMTDNVETTYKKQIQIEAPKVLGTVSDSEIVEMIANQW